MSASHGLPLASKYRCFIARCITMHFRVLFEVIAFVVYLQVAICQDLSSKSNLEDDRRVPVNYGELSKQLSKSAEFHAPGSGAFDNAVARWSNLSTPIATVVIIPGDEEDVVKIVSSWPSIQLENISQSIPRRFA